MAKMETRTNRKAAEYNNNMIDKDDNDNLLNGIRKTWSMITDRCVHKPIRYTVVGLSKFAARNPWWCICSITLISFGLALVGLLTNFRLESRQYKLFSPIGSKSTQHGDWIQSQSGASSLEEEQPKFPLERMQYIMIHANGASVLNVPAVRGVFWALDTLRSSPGYKTICLEKSRYTNFQGEPTCRINSVTGFWDHNVTLFEESMTELQRLHPSIHEDDLLRHILSQSTFPNGVPVTRNFIFGTIETESLSSSPSLLQLHKSITSSNTTTTTTTTTTTANTLNFNADETETATTLLTLSKSFTTQIGLPFVEGDTDAIEEYSALRLTELQNEIRQNNNIQYALEFYSFSGYSMEYQRAILKDIPLVGLVFVVMSIFTCVVFHRNDKVESRSMVGFFSICTIGMSIMTGHGIMFILGVPYTSLAQLLCFIVFGIGLDDTFIITGAYYRELEEDRKLQNQRSVEERVEYVMEETGLSISLTTITTVTAFSLGYVSTIPAVRWLCLYAGTTLFIDFIYQTTFFVAWLVLDERRVQSRRYAWFIWIVDDSENGDSVFEDESSPSSSSSSAWQPINNNNDQKNNDDEIIIIEENQEDHHHLSVRIMEWYAEQLLRPWVRIVVLLFFSILLGISVWSTFRLSQEFKPDDLVPNDSFVRGYFASMDSYSEATVFISVYFRNVDQSDPVVQSQMMDFISDLSELDQIGQEPEYFWLPDAQEFAMNSPVPLDGLTFTEQLDLALANTVVRTVYGNDILRDPQTGEIIASRCRMIIPGVSYVSDVQTQIDMLLDQREVTRNQPINNRGNDGDDDEWAFFTFAEAYPFWELSAVSVQELKVATFSGVTAVTMVGFLIMPHWSASLFVCPLIMMLYFNLLGMMQLCGVHINSISYILIVMAIGLLVDFLMHILLRYYESSALSREEKVKETLRTMGSSIILGGITTLLGMCPLVLSTTTVFKTVLIAFFWMVFLGCGVGLILLPVILSFVGPIHLHSNNKNIHKDKELSNQKTTTDNNNNNDLFLIGCGIGIVLLPAILSHVRNYNTNTILMEEKNKEESGTKNTYNDKDNNDLILNVGTLEEETEPPLSSPTGTQNFEDKKKNDNDNGDLVILNMDTFELDEEEYNTLDL